MKYRALLRVILLVWLHVTIVSAARYPKEFTELAREFIAAKHNIPRGRQTLTFSQDQLTMEEFVKRGAAIIGIACSLEKVRKAFLTIVGRLKKPDQRKAANKKSNDIHNPINKANGSQAVHHSKEAAKLKETSRVNREVTLRKNPKIANHVLTKEQIAAQCELWLDETDDRLVGRDGEVLTWRQAIVSGLFAIYFGTTRRTLKIEWLRWLTERGSSLPCHAKNGRNRPVLRRMTGETITMKEAEDELGFWCAEVGVGDIVNHNCRGKEDYLQTHLTNSTRDIDDTGKPHCRLGQQLHRCIGKGAIEEKENEIFRVFASVAPITKHYFDLRPINEELRSTIWLKGTQCRVVH
mmetsp:Transcript_3479/g.15885  ORF Transcript_3479/g.15885 Transcript_3479/m.15885 type:complete len:351 (-) Transcript_3479:47-1099(-)